jgi:hypothetical protein
MVLIFFRLILIFIYIITLEPNMNANFIYTITLEPNMNSNQRKLTDGPVQKKKKNVLVDRLVYKAARFT